MKSKPPKLNPFKYLFIISIILIISFIFILNNKNIKQFSFQKDNNISKTTSTSTILKNDNWNTISFNSTLNIPISFQYPQNWTVVRDSNSLKGQGNLNGFYERIRIYSPSKNIYIELFVDNNFIGADCNGQTLSQQNNLIKLNNYPNLVYVENVNLSNINNSDEGLNFKAQLEPNPPNQSSCSGAFFYKSGALTTSINSDNFFSANIVAKETSRYYFDSVAVNPNIVVTQNMIDKVTSSDEFKTAKTILLSAKNIN